MMFLLFLFGLKLSDKVIKRMRQSSTVTSPRTSKNETPTLDSTPSVEHLTPPPPPPSTPCPPPQVAPSSAVKRLPPPPVKFHSLPPPSVEPAATSPTLPDLAVSAPPSPQMEASVSPPPVESFVPPQAERETPSKVPVTEPIVLPPPAQSSTADPPEPPSSPLPPEPVKPTAAFEPSSMPPSVEPVVSLTPQVEKVQPSPTVDSTLDNTIFPPANSAPDDAGVSPVHESEVPPPGVMLPGVPPPPPLLDASSSDPELTIEEPSPHCHRSHLAILPTDTPINEPHIAPPLPNPAPPAEQPTITTPPHHVEDEVPAKGELTVGKKFNHIHSYYFTIVFIFYSFPSFSQNDGGRAEAKDQRGDAKKSGGRDQPEEAGAAATVRTNRNLETEKHA